LAPVKIEQPVNIAIIGGGFCGILTAIHLLQNEGPRLNIHLVNKGYPLARGIAYAPHTASLLLNVPNDRMSAFAGSPDHYVNWLMKNGPANFTAKNELSAAFSTRQQYGDYLTALWAESLAKPGTNKAVRIYDDYADDITENGPLLHVHLRENPLLTVNIAVLATGNDGPCLPAGIAASILNSKRYFGNPWKKDCIEGVTDNGEILIIGNGLTMVDTVIGLTKNGYKGVIHTISPHGYQLKPWKEAKAPYTGINFEGIEAGKISLLGLVRTLNKHRKAADGLNLSVYPVIDSLRPKIQELWQSFSLKEKQQFIKYLDVFWGSIRHRLPAKMQQTLTALRNEGRLITGKGGIVSVTISAVGLDVTLNCGGNVKQLTAQRIINCTGPGVSVTHTGNRLLNNLAKKGLINPGPCGLGINTNPHNGHIISAQQATAPNIYVIGNHLKGTLWESTAVPELRVQAEKLAGHILSEISSKAGRLVEPA
jgi:uncharacterized NAD(P)/FAD-binding protein YdhS